MKTWDNMMWVLFQKRWQLMAIIEHGVDVTDPIGRKIADEHLEVLLYERTDGKRKYTVICHGTHTTSVDFIPLESYYDQWKKGVYAQTALLKEIPYGKKLKYNIDPFSNQLV